MPGVIVCPGELCDYIHCVPCPSNPAGAPDYYIRSGNAPGAVTTFKVGAQCYTIDPADPMGPLPQGSFELTGIGTVYDDCDACLAPEEPPGPPGGGGGNGGGGSGGGGGGGGSGGGGGGPPTDPPPDVGFHAVLCAGQTGSPPVVWVVFRAGDARGTFIFRFQDWCFEVDTTGTATVIPDTATKVQISGTYDKCTSCIGGIPLTICAGQNVGTVPDYWIRKTQIPAAPRFVRIDGICFTVNPDLPVSPIPPNAVIIHPPAEFDSCDDCVKGVLAVLCTIPQEEGPDKPQQKSDKAPPVWVGETWLPAGVVIFRHKGWCYTLDPDDELTSKPADADVVYPVNEFEDCAACICGQRIDDVDRPQGVKCFPCQGRSRTRPSADLWVPEDQLPIVTYPENSLEPCPKTPADQFIYFLHDGVCYWLDPGGRRQVIPVGATVIGLPPKQYSNCFECITANPPPRIIGYPATPCPDQEDPPPLNVIDEGYPPHSTFYFVYGGYCYSFNTDDLQPVPDGVYARKFYSECEPCITDNPPEGGGGGGGGNPPGGGGGNYPPDSTKNGLRLWTCAGDGSDGVGGGEPTELCVLKTQGLAGKIILIGDSCYRVSAQQVDCGGPLAFDQAYQSCVFCIADRKCYRLYHCDDESASDLYITIFKWAQNGGNGLPVMKIDGVCYYADTSTKFDPAGKTLVNPSATDRYTTCEACADDRCDIWSIKWNCALTCAEYDEFDSCIEEGPPIGWQDFAKIQSNVACDTISLGDFDEWVWVGNKDGLCEFRAKSHAGSAGPFTPTNHDACGTCAAPPAIPCDGGPILGTPATVYVDLVNISTGGAAATPGATTIVPATWDAGFNGWKWEGTAATSPYKYGASNTAVTAVYIQFAVDESYFNLGLGCWVLTTGISTGAALGSTGQAPGQKGGLTVIGDFYTYEGTDAFGESNRTDDPPGTAKLITVSP